MSRWPSERSRCGANKVNRSASAQFAAEEIELSYLLTK
jgi:hypothetical protein